MLIAATILSAVLGDWLAAAAILAIVILNALLGFFQGGDFFAGAGSSIVTRDRENYPRSKLVRSCLCTTETAAKESS